MGGHGSDHHAPSKSNYMQESDEEMLQKIRPIELIKHNPNHFHVNPFDAPKAFEVVGGISWLTCTAVGGLFGYWYYNQKIRFNPSTFYMNIMLSFSRIALGAAIGGWVGYMKFGDRQRLHNAWVAERLRRRYPESMNLDAQNLWTLKGVKAGHQFYRWV